jgi:competence protein ComEA
VERWLPGGTHGVEGARALARRHPFAIVILLIVLVVAICAAIAMSGQRQLTEAAPSLPAAISAGPSAAATTSAPPPATLVISVVGKVARPGLVTLLDGARVADAIRAAGGAIPGTNDLALNLARKLADGEQIYVGIPVPAGTAPADDATQPSAANSSTAPTARIDLNTATEDQLDALPGVGPATAQHILTWREQHGHFDSVGQLRDVQGIGDGRFAKIEKLVTT